MKIKLSKRDYMRMVKLSKRAQNTPIVALTSEAAINGRDFASLAYKSVQDLWKELATKYKFRLSTVKNINHETGVFNADKL